MTDSSKRKNTKRVSANKSTEKGGQSETHSSAIEEVQVLAGNPADTGARVTAVRAETLMPREAGFKQILQQRAAVLAGLSEGEDGAEERVQYLRFRLGPMEHYGIPYEFMDTLLYVSDIAVIPGTPACIAGVINYRGVLLTVLDLKQFFHTQAQEPTEEARIMVVSDGRMRVGLLADAVEGNEEYPPTRLAPPLASDGITDIKYIAGIHAGTVTMLNMEALLGDPSLVVDEGPGA